MDILTNTKEKTLVTELLVPDSPDISYDAESYNEMSGCFKLSAELVEIDPITGDCLEFYDTELSNKASPLSEESAVTFDFSSSSVAAISVVAIDSNDERAWYSEPGASILVSTFSSYISEEEGKDKEIDRENVFIDYIITNFVGEDGYEQENYTNSFGGISPAAPVVSGVTALILEANPSLTWRDVQHILVETSRKNDADDNGWAENGAGYDVNYRYGFGAVDAAAAVEAAEIWNSVGEEIQVSPGSYDVNLAILDYDSKAYPTSSLTLGENSPDLAAILDFFNKPADSNTDSTDLPIDPQLSKALAEANLNHLESTINITEDINAEWVEVEFDANHSYRGDFKIVLVSPDGGTESLLADRDADATETGEAGQFVVSSQGNLDDFVTVNYALAEDAVNGIDYQSLPGTVTISSGETQVTIATVPNSDCQLEANGTIYTFSLFHEFKQHIKTWLSKFYAWFSSGLYHFCMNMRFCQRTGLRLRSARTAGLFLQNCSNLWNLLDLLYDNLFPSSAWEPAWAMAGSGSPQLWQMSDNFQSSKVKPAASSSKSSKKNAPENEELDPPLSALEEDILTALGYKERYGLEIIEVIERASEGTRKLGPGSLYPTLRRLQKKGYLESRWGDDDDGTGERGGARRRYYKVSDRGLKKLQQTRSFRERLILASGGEQILAGA